MTGEKGGGLISTSAKKRLAALNAFYTHRSTDYSPSKGYRLIQQMKIKKKRKNLLVKENTALAELYNTVNKIYNMDCIEGMQQICNNSIDLVITDPPFAIGFKANRSNYNRTNSRVIEGYQEISQEKYYKFTLQWMKEVYRVLKESGSMYVFSGWNNLRDILNALDNST